MDAIEALVARLPGQTEQIRRRFWRDPEFRSVCDDFRDAADTMVRLEHSGPLDSAKLAEYRSLVTEILDEAIDMLGRENHEDTES